MLLYAVHDVLVRPVLRLKVKIRIHVARDYRLTRADPLVLDDAKRVSEDDGRRRHRVALLSDLLWRLSRYQLDIDLRLHLLNSPPDSILVDIVDEYLLEMAQRPRDVSHVRFALHAAAVHTEVFSVRPQSCCRERRHGRRPHLREPCAVHHCNRYARSDVVHYLQARGLRQTVLTRVARKALDPLDPERILPRDISRHRMEEYVLIWMHPYLGRHLVFTAAVRDHRLPDELQHLVLVRPALNALVPGQPYHFFPQLKM